LRNTGDQSIDKIEITVYFKDDMGRTIAEEQFYPVRISRPLKPGYVWQMERGKFYSAPSVPSEWLEGYFEALITDIEFSKPD
jgi:hypothetical protein